MSEQQASQFWKDGQLSDNILGLLKFYKQQKAELHPYLFTCIPLLQSKFVHKGKTTKDAFCCLKPDLQQREFIPEAQFYNTVFLVNGVIVAWPTKELAELHYPTAYKQMSQTNESYLPYLIEIKLWELSRSRLVYRATDGGFIFPLEIGRWCLR